MVNGPNVSWRVPRAGWLIVAAAAAMWAAAAPPAWAAKTKAPVVMIVAPNPAITGARGELAVQMNLSHAVLRSGRLKVTVTGPTAKTVQDVSLTKVQGATYEGLFTVGAVGSYTAKAMFTSGGKVWTVAKAFKAVKGNPTSSALRFIIVIVLFGGAWLFLNRRRRS